MSHMFDKDDERLTPSASRQAEEAMLSTRKMDEAIGLKRRFVTRGSWAVAGLMTLVAVGAMAALAARPAGRDRNYVSVVYTDGHRVEAYAEELPPSAKTDVLSAFLQNYAQAREGYSWASEEADYRMVSAWSAPDVREAYQRFMTVGERRPEAVYGTGLNAQTATVEDVFVQGDPTAPNAGKIYYTLVVRGAGKPDTRSRYMALVTWNEDDPSISIANRKKYNNALGIAVVRWTTVAMSAR